LRKLMPPGCATVRDAVDRFLNVLTGDDLLEIDRRVQSVLEPDDGGLLGVCADTAGGVERVVSAGFEETRAHLGARVGAGVLAAGLGRREEGGGGVEQG